MQQRFKFRYVNEITGIFVIGVLILLIAGVFMGERSQRWFTHKYHFDLLLPEQGTFGLKRGSEVYILGIDVGIVDQIHVEPDGRMKARVRIRSDFARFVRMDSVASIKKTFGVAGDSFVEISSGTGAALPKVSPTIPCLSSEELPGMMEKLLDELRREIVPVLKKGGESLDAWTRLASNVDQTQTDLRRLVERLDRLTAGLEEGRGTAGRLLQDSSIADNAEQLLSDSRQLITNSHAALKELEGAMENIRKGTVRLPEITEAVATESRDLPGLVLRTQQTVHELERLLEGLQRHWLVRKHVAPPQDSGSRISPSRVTGGAP